jgi:UrcA family protein
MSRIILSASLFAALVLATPASFAEKPVTKEISVDYSDLDLGRPAGAQTLMSRLETASKKVCGARPMQVRYGQLKRYLQCRSNAVEVAVRRIDEPTVTLAFENSIGRKPVRLASH